MSNKHTDSAEETIRVEICYSADDAYASMPGCMVEHNGHCTAEAIECTPPQICRPPNGLLRRQFIRNHRGGYLRTSFGGAVVNVVRRGQTEGRESMDAEGQPSRLYMREPELWRDRERITLPVSRPSLPPVLARSPPTLLTAAARPARSQPSPALARRWESFRGALVFPCAPP